MKLPSHARNRRTAPRLVPLLLVVACDALPGLGGGEPPPPPPPPPSPASASTGAPPAAGGALGSTTEAKPPNEPEPRASPCEPPSWDGHAEQPRLRRTALHRSPDLIVDFQLASVLPEGTPVPAPPNDALFRLRTCGSRSEDERGPPEGFVLHDPQTGLSVEVLGYEDMSRGAVWDRALGRCGLRIFDPEHPTLEARLEGDDVPIGTYPAHLARDGARAWVGLHSQTYSGDVGEKGNRVVALDLCARRIAWTSDDLVSNTELVLYDEYLITGQGFTGEPDALFFLDRLTGRTLLRQALPKAADQLVVVGDTLWVRIYDGYAAFQVR